MKRMTRFNGHGLARTFYWASLLFLMAGGWLLIDPFARRAGETAQIYIPVAASEIYIWLLLGLALWQRRHGLRADVTRAGVFTAVLAGMGLMAINELYLVSETAALSLAWIWVALLLLKLAIAPAVLGLAMAWPLRAAAACWIVMCALPPMLLRTHLADSRTAPHATAYGACWLVAALAGLHLALVAWQRHRGWRRRPALLGEWWHGWVPVGIFAAMGALQLWVSLRGFFIDWAAAYFSPIVLAVGIVWLSLAIARGRRLREAMLVQAFVLLYVVVAAGYFEAPENLPASWTANGGRSWLDPWLTGGTWLTLLLIGGGLSTARWSFAATGLVPGLTASGYKVSTIVVETRGGPGILLISAAFILLAAGAILQHWHLRRQRQQEAVEPVPEIPDHTAV